MTRACDAAAVTLTERGPGTYLPVQWQGDGPDSRDELLSITDLARELAVSARTLRFYEDKGLITPRRVGTARVYATRERARMILILRGKTLGFSLREIKTYLDLYDADPAHEIQTRTLLEKIAARRRQLEDKRSAIDEALLGLDHLERDARAGMARRANDLTTEK